MNPTTIDLHLPLRIAELKGKYYGTDVVDARDRVVTTIWYHTQFNPSSREEAKRINHHERAIGENKPCDNSWETGCGCEDWYADSHYESEETLILAETFVKAVNESLGLQ